MSIWRPPQRIRVVAVGLVWRGSELLVAEVRDDDGGLKGVRPLGGEVEFGETWEVGLRREFQEELGLEITLRGAPLVIENLFEHGGAVGHEVVFATDVALPEGALDRVEEIDFCEDNGTRCRAIWVALGSADGPGPALFPTGLKLRLLARG